MNNNIEPVVMLNDVTKIYQTNDHKASGVKNISLSVYNGEMLLILGPSGSGKTTLLTLIAGLIKPSSGKVNLFNKDIESYSRKEIQQIRAAKIGFVFQTFLLIDSLSVIENIMLVQRFVKNDRNLLYKKSLELLEQFGIEDLAKKSPKNLSQGEKQRTALARAIANDAGLILADEPTASLESHQGFEIINLLHRFAKEEKRCVIVVSHDLRLKDFADRVVWLENGILN
jgi:putative ABC transport system ATP-binding protein